MPRRREIPKREVPARPDLQQLAGDEVHQHDDERRQAQHRRADHVQPACASIKEKTGDDPLKVFKKAVENVKPALEVKSRRVGGSNYQVPVEVNPNRRLSLSIRWLVGYARDARRRQDDAGKARERAAWTPPICAAAR